jgi:hypothetical protein
MWVPHMWKMYAPPTGIITLNWNLNKQDERVWSKFICLRIGTSGEFLEYGNEISGFIKCREFPD